MAAVMPYNFVTYGVWVWYNQISTIAETLSAKYNLHYFKVDDFLDK